MAVASAVRSRGAPRQTWAAGSARPMEEASGVRSQDAPRSTRAEVNAGPTEARGAADDAIASSQRAASRGSVRSTAGLACARFSAVGDWCAHRVTRGRFVRRVRGTRSREPQANQLRRTAITLTAALETARSKLQKARAHLTWSIHRSLRPPRMRDAMARRSPTAWTMAAREALAETATASKTARAIVQRRCLLRAWRLC
jgi:hypothetical protein